MQPGEERACIRERREEEHGDDGDDFSSELLYIHLKEKQIPRV